MVRALPFLLPFHQANTLIDILIDWLVDCLPWDRVALWDSWACAAASVSVSAGGHVTRFWRHSAAESGRLSAAPRHQCSACDQSLTDRPTSLCAPATTCTEHTHHSEREKRKRPVLHHHHHHHHHHHQRISGSRSNSLYFHPTYPLWTRITTKTLLILLLHCDFRCYMSAL